MFSELLKRSSGYFDLTENLVAHYLLNNNADDNHGTYDGTPTSVDFQGDVAEFNGSTGFIGTTSDIVSGDVTWSEWVKLTSATTTQMYTLGQLQVGDKNRAIDYSTNLIRGFSRDSSGAFKAISYTTTDVEQESWTHIVFVQNGTTIKLYINGVLEDSLDMITTYTFSTQFTIGQHPSQNSTFYLDGAISNVRIYSDVKNQAFIDNLYAEGYYPKPLIEPTTVGLIAHYPLTGTAEDVTGTYDGVEGNVSYVDDAEFGSVVVVDNEDTDYIDITGISTTNGAFSFSTWYNVGSIGNNLVEYFLDAQTGRSIFARYSNFNSNISIYDGTWLNFNYTPTIGTWVHISFISTGSQVLLYIDGEYHSTLTASMNSLGGTTTLFSSYAKANSAPLGKFKDVRIYDGTLTAQEITDIYNYEKNFRSIDIDDGLEAFYPLGDNSNDNYYNEFDCTDTSVTYDGISGDYNGTTSGSQIPSGSITLGTNHVSTLCAWVKVQTLPTVTEGRIVFPGAADFTTGVTTTGYFRTGLYNPSPAINVSTEGTSALTLNQWYFVVGVWDDTDLILYLDGEFESSVTGGVPAAYTNQGGIGYNGSTATKYLDGNLAKVRIYSKSLDANQIKAIYDSEKGDFI